MIKVLIVEDDPMVAEINREYLRRVAGLSLVGIVKNGMEAFSFLERQKVELILLDVFMPQMDGITFLQEVKKKYPEIDILMITAAQSKEKVRKALSLGVVDYIIKPFTFERIQIALTSYLERRRILEDDSDIDQSILDTALFMPKTERQGDLPKGIEMQTLRRVQGAAEKMEAAFSTQELADVVGISRISMRKYLNHLEQMGVVHGTLTYRTKGRPIQLYTYNKWH